MEEKITSHMILPVEKTAGLVKMDKINNILINSCQKFWIGKGRTKVLFQFTGCHGSEDLRPRRYLIFDFVTSTVNMRS